MSVCLNERERERGGGGVRESAPKSTSVRVVATRSV